MSTTASSRTNSMTRQLSQRVSRVVRRRDETSSEQTEAKSVAGWTHWIYDWVLFSLTAFCGGLFVLNLMLSAQVKEQRNQWHDRLQFEQQFRHWERHLKQQSKQVIDQCQQLSKVLITSPDSTAKQQELQRLTTLRDLLRSTEQLANGLPDEFTPNSAAKFTQQLTQLMAVQAKLQQQYQAGHPELNLIQQEINDLQQKIAGTEPANSSSNTTNPAIQVITNQYLRPASNTTDKSSETTTALKTASEKYQQLQSNFQQLRQATQSLVQWIEQQRGTTQRDNELRSTLWSQVAQQLRGLDQSCTPPVTLQKVLAPTQQHTEPAPQLSGWALLGNAVCSLGIGLVMLRYLPRVSNTERTASERVGNGLTVEQVSQTLGTAPLAILESSLNHRVDVVRTENLSNGTSINNSRTKLRLICESTVGVMLLATVLMVFVHPDFGSWLVDNPLSAWGRWLGQ